MRIILFAAAVASALPVPALARVESSPQAVLAGKVAGQPTDCLAPFERDRETRTYASGDILYRGAGSTWYLNHPDGCPRFTSTMILSTVSPSQLCRGDILRINDQLSHAFIGSCSLGSFVPYTDPTK